MYNGLVYRIILMYVGQDLLELASQIVATLSQLTWAVQRYVWKSCGIIQYGGTVY